MLHRLQRVLAAQCRLVELLVVGPDVAVKSGLQIFAGSEVVTLPDLLDASVELFDHVVGSGGGGAGRR